MRRAFICRLRRAEYAIAQPVLKFGGCPVFHEATDWPECDSCDAEMDFLAQIPLQEPLPFSHRFAMAFVFMCPAKSDLACETWDPDAGCNRVILQERSDSAFSGTRDDTPDFGTYPDYEISLTDSEEPEIDTADIHVDRSLRDQVSSETKLGGVPMWIQSNQMPSCPECGGESTFIAQLNAELDGLLPSDRQLWERYHFLNFGDVGHGYVFLCRNECSPEGAAFLWQC